MAGALGGQSAGGPASAVAGVRTVILSIVTNVVSIVTTVAFTRLSLTEVDFSCGRGGEIYGNIEVT